MTDFVNLVNWLKHDEYCNSLSERLRQRQLYKSLHDNLEAVEDSPKATLRERAKSLKHNIKSATKKNQAEIQSKLDEAKASIAAKKQEFDDYRAKLKTQFEEIKT